MVKIVKPSGDGHAGDTFRELVDLWEREGLVEVEYANTNFVWWGGVGEYILYDRPTLQWYNANVKCKGILFGNTIPSGGQPWIFWGRRPSFMDKILKKQGVNPVDKREVESIFLGKVENNVQLNFRDNVSWKDVVEVFEMPINGSYKYTQYEYLKMLNKSKFGLCLRGYGPKCNREIELFSLGVVPVVTPEVDLTFYNKLEEGVHYLKVNDPSEFSDTVKSISDEKWSEMSKAGHDWYLENCSTKGSFETTKKIIENYG